MNQCTVLINSKMVKPTAQSASDISTDNIRDYLIIVLHPYQKLGYISHFIPDYSSLIFGDIEPDNFVRLSLAKIHGQHERYQKTQNKLKMFMEGESGNTDEIDTLHRQMYVELSGVICRESIFYSFPHKSIIVEEAEINNVFTDSQQYLIINMKFYP